MDASTALRTLGPGDLYPCEPGPLSRDELQGLWEIFRAINRTWGLFRDDEGVPTEHALSRARSAWREFVRLRVEPTAASRATPAYRAPSYLAEYRGALAVVAELERTAPDDAFDLLFAVGTPGAKAPPPDADLSAEALLHAKRFVVDEFMSVMVVAGGFKQFGAKNYNGFMAGSRSSRTVPLRAPFTYPQRTSRHGG